MERLNSFPEHSFERERLMKNKFNYQESTILTELLNITNQKKSEIDSYRPLQNLSLWTVLQEKLRSDWTYHSNAIEGSTLTQSETIFFLKEGLTIEGKPFKDFLDAQNHAEAIDFTYEVVKDKRPFTQGLMKQFNELLMKGVSYTEAIDQFGNRVKKKVYAGEYKKESNSVLTLKGNIHNYVDPLQVEPQMEELFTWISEKEKNIHPVILASIAHYNFVRIHPFDDGNGRGARILLNLILLKNGFPPAIIKTEQRRLYLESLNEADNNNLTPFIEFVSKSLINTEELVLETLKHSV